MNYYKLGISLLALVFVNGLEAQTEEKAVKENKNKNSVKYAPSPAEIATETTSKTYMIQRGDDLVKNSVEITIEQEQAIAFDEESEGKVNKDRVLDAKMITKTVAIDNDADEDHDEIIQFSYRSDAPQDFVLLSNSDEIFVALDRGENLEIIEEESFEKKDLNADRDSYVYTTDDGQQVEFYIKKYENLDAEGSKRSSSMK